MYLTRLASRHLCITCLFLNGKYRYQSISKKQCVTFMKGETRCDKFFSHVYQGYWKSFTLLGKNYFYFLRIFLKHFPQILSKLPKHISSHFLADIHVYSLEKNSLRVQGRQPSQTRSPRCVFANLGGSRPSSSLGRRRFVRATAKSQDAKSHVARRRIKGPRSEQIRAPLRHPLFTTTFECVIMIYVVYDGRCSQEETLAQLSISNDEPSRRRERGRDF